MKGVKCYLGLVISCIICSLFLSPSLGVNALKHDYNAIPLFYPTFPLSTSTGTDGLEHINWSNNYTGPFGLTYPSGFDMAWEGDGFYSDLNSFDFDTFFLRLSPISYENGQCSTAPDYFGPTLKFEISNNTASFYSPLNQFIYTQLDISNFDSSYSYYNCLRMLPFGSSPQPAFNNGSISSTWFRQSGMNNGLPKNVGFNTFMNNTIFNDYMSPYYFTYDMLYLHDTYVDTDSGIHYNHSLSFKDIFGQPVKKFSGLMIPMYDYSDYWVTASNFTVGRSLEFRGAFEFDDTVAFNPNMDPNSYFRVSAKTNAGTMNYDCTFNLRDVPGADFHQIEYTCPITLQANFAYFFPRLEMYNPNSYVFTTDGDWRWASQILVTDNDETIGQSFGNPARGFGSAESEAGNDDSADWYSSLINLFNFGLINPFAPIFELFDNESVCANIPTIAGMLHSEESQVCPFFDSSVRAVTTPILGISSIMLLFGFVVRWLGASSGNMFEDSGHIAPPTDLPAGSAGVRHVGWRRK